MKKQLCLAAMLLTVTLTGCAESSGSYGTVSDSLTSSSFAYDISYDYSNSSSSSSSSGCDSEADIVKSTMMIVRDADVTVNASNLEEFDTYIVSRVSDYDGYFEESEINDYNSTYSTSRWSYYTIRIPQSSLDEFLDDVDGASSIVSKSISSEDVSLDYVDITSRITALESEKESLLRLLDYADSVSDIIEIQDQLSDVQYRLDSYNSKKLLLEGRVSYSTVKISAREERNIEHPIAMAFDVNFKEEMVDGIESAVEVFVKIIAAIPVIIILSAFLLLFIWVWRQVWHRIFKRNAGRIRYVLTPVSEQAEPSPEKKHKPFEKNDKPEAQQLDK